MRNREPETIADVIEDLAKDYGLTPEQKISTLIKASEDDELDDDDDEDDDDDDEDEDDDDEDESSYLAGYDEGFEDGSSND